MQTSFSGVTYPGHLTVIKALDVGDNGTLMSPTCPHEWKNGNNYAACHNRLNGLRYPIDHRTAALNCTCGFYAYYTTENAASYRNISTAYNAVLVICKAWGRVTCGHLGARSEKMKIEAIIVKNSEAGYERPTPPAPLAEDSKWMVLATFLVIGLGVLSFIFNQLIAGVPALVTNVMFVVQLVVFIPWAYFTVKSWPSVWAYWKASRKYSKDVSEWADKVLTNQIPYLSSFMEYDVPEPLVEVIRLQYPDTPIYTSVEEALKDFPLSSPPATPQAPGGDAVR